MMPDVLNHTFSQIPPTPKNPHRKPNKSPKSERLFDGGIPARPVAEWVRRLVATSQLWAGFGFKF